jgi:hypothetical protein
MLTTAAGVEILDRAGDHRREQVLDLVNRVVGIRRRPEL